jgi:hypothetical protein
LVVPQQMRAEGEVQSLSEVHAFGHVDEQTPLQQRGVVALAAQSESCAHDLGQSVAWRHSDCALAARLGSSLFAPAQQTSPPDTLQSWSCLQVTGHAFCAVQMGVAYAVQHLPVVPASPVVAQSESLPQVMRPWVAVSQTFCAPGAIDRVSQPSPLVVLQSLLLEQKIGQLWPCTHALTLPKLQQTRPDDVSQSLS